MVSLAFYYFVWHYTKAFSDMVRIWGNFMWFFWNFFSIGLLLKTFFLPFRRIEDKPAKGFNPELVFENIIVGMLMRSVGIALRLFVIGIGVIALSVTTLVGIAFFVSWFLAPFIVISLFGGGLMLIFI